MTDIVERLRDTPLTVGRLTIEGLFVEAADEIERLRIENTRLTADLRERRYLAREKNAT